MYNYIPHPSNARVQNEVLELLVEEGPSGYGIYWMLLEMLRDAPSYKLPFKPKSLAFGLHLSECSQLERIVNNYGLFSVDTLGFFSSCWLNSQMEEYDEKKKKLQEAGRRGAAQRWKPTESQGPEQIATLSDTDSKAKAYNATKYNDIQQDIILPDLSGSSVVSMDLVQALIKTQPAGHNSGYVAQICNEYGMKEETLNFICQRSNNADLTHPTYIKFCALVKRIKAEKWQPKHPDGFFLKKLFVGNE